MKIYDLRQLLTIRNGKDHKSILNGSIPIFGSGGIMRFGNQYLYDKPSILLPRKGSLHNIQFSKIPFWTVDTLYYTEINEQLAEPYFLYNYLRILDLENLNTGTGVPSMTFDSYYNLKISLPEISVQNKIANIINNIDNKIDLNNQINDNLSYYFIQLLPARSSA
ncbi:restriction endonuclease subunit S [Chryseobacterium formosus]|uniref:Restriction endonuclease subunit S n=1 Tax=Chryseobacterium formosus TaxID=1537363 RepID=A0ABT3XPS0_9FLAO|nr:restriction endonuclease subunit S [Chryseobacterium formosus]MCX8523121.1 restriction endonuclease subunit S [Chryseobacterium formosus]